MRDGLAIIITPSGYSPYVRIGWVEREDDWLRLRNSVVIRRFGNRAQLGQLARTGPASDTQLLDLVEERGCHIGQVIDWTPADPKKWPQCPKPTDHAGE